MLEYIVLSDIMDILLGFAWNSQRFHTKLSKALRLSTKTFFSNGSFKLSELISFNLVTLDKFLLKYSSN